MSDPVTRLNAALEGSYAIERELGEGGMATVYLAEDLRHERKVALKVLKPELAAVVGAERFLTEIKVTANLQHPHILPLFDSGEADGFLFYVMPYVEGETLRARVDREKQLPVDEAVRIATAVASALDHAHRHDVIHRDIKPANILLQDGEPVVADFGIALALDVADGNRLTETGLSLGTPYYMSPEQATGDQPVGASTDTYALGSVLYEMLVGDPPYPGSTAQAVLGKIMAGNPVSATEQRPSIPANVDAAVRKALEKLPADRFSSAQDFVRALGDEHFRYGEDVAGVTDVSAGPWNRLTLAMTVVVALSTLAFGWSFLRPDPAGPTLATAEPLVLMMDSHHPLRVYDEETIASGGTNADVVSDILLDLPIRRQRESISLNWNRDEEILQFDPDLIVIHYSGFRQEDGAGPRVRLKLLISYFVESDTRFLVYSRQEEEELEQRMEDLLADLEAEHPGLMSRISVFGLFDYGPSSWLSPLTANPLKLRVKEILGL